MIEAARHLIIFELTIKFKLRLAMAVLMPHGELTGYPMQSLWSKCLGSALYARC